MLDFLPMQNPPTALAMAGEEVKGLGPERSADGTAGTASAEARPKASPLPRGSLRPRHRAPMTAAGRRPIEARQGGLQWVFYPKGFKGIS